MTPCYKCWSIEGDACMLGKKCEHYSKQNLEEEVQRRNEERAQRLRARADKLVNSWKE